jgi:hypothetical protein
MPVSGYGVASFSLARRDIVYIMRQELRVPNIMKHVCVASQNWDDAKGGVAHIANMGKSPDKVSHDSGRNPSGWHEFWPNGFVAPLVNIRDIHCGSLRALSQNRDSASRVSLC